MSCDFRFHSPSGMLEVDEYVSVFHLELSQLCYLLLGNLRYFNCLFSVCNVTVSLGVKSMGAFVNTTI